MLPKHWIELCLMLSCHLLILSCNHQFISNVFLFFFLTSQTPFPSQVGEGVVNDSILTMSLLIIIEHARFLSMCIIPENKCQEVNG